MIINNHIVLSPKVHRFYSLLLALSLSLHIFNLGGGDYLKPFHVTAALASVITVLYVKKDKTFRTLALFLFCVLVSAVISPVTGAFSGFINLLIVTLCCYGVSLVSIEGLLKYLTILVPIDLVVLLYTAITSPTYRFQGFYDDPNYLCTTLLVFFFICILGYLRLETKYARYINAASMVVIIVLILMTLSRTGLFCVSFLLLMFLLGTIKKHLLKVVFVAILSLFVIHHYASDFINAEYALIYERVFDNSDNIESAGEHRAELSKQNIRFILDNPQYVAFGLGPGSTDGEQAKKISGLAPYRKSHSRDHNTWTSCFSEYGIVALFFFMLIFYRISRSVKCQRKGTIKYVCVGFFVVLLLFSFSIWQMTYLPFWWGVFLLSNFKLSENEYSY